MRIYWQGKWWKVYDIAACSTGMTADGYSRLLIQINIELLGMMNVAFFKYMIAI